MHRHLDDELQELKALLLEMSALVDEQFTDAVTALLNRDRALAEQVRRRDDEVDAAEMNVDRQCERILALYQPVAADLRMLIIAVKINTDLERIGDHCKNLAKHTLRLDGAGDVLAQTRIEEMADVARAMLRDVEDAFLRRDRAKARQVLARDADMDQLHKETFRNLIAYGQQHPGEIEYVAHLVTASKGLERIADHAKNIAENVVFLIEGVDIRHQRLRAGDEAAEQG